MYINCQSLFIIFRSKLPLKKKVALNPRSHRKKKDKGRDADLLHANNNGKNKKRVSIISILIILKFQLLLVCKVT